jgi:hypothetical protein
MRILRAVDRAHEYLPLRTVVRFLRMSPSRFDAWRRRQRVWARRSLAVLAQRLGARSPRVRQNEAMSRSVPRPRNLCVKAKFWLTLGPRTLFGDGKAKLLEAVDELGSLRSAAQSMGMSLPARVGVARERCRGHAMGESA